MMDELTQLRRAVDDRFDATKGFLRELVQAPSVLGNEEGAQSVVEARMRELGFYVRSVEPDASRLSSLPEAGVPLVSYAGRRCVLGELKGKGSDVLVLNGHVDVVSPEPEELWRLPPFEAQEIDGRLHGRGAADMKGGVAAMLLAVEAARSLGPLPSTVIYQSVIEEECTGNGAVACCLEGPGAHAALIAEPTGEAVHVAGVGVIFARITIAGDSGHALSADQLANPIETAYEVIGALRSLEKQMNERPHDPMFADVDQPYLLNIGALHGGDWPASSPAKAELEVRLGFPADIEPPIAQSLLTDAVRRASSRARVDFVGHRAHGYAFDPEAPFVQLLRACHEEVRGASAPVEGVRATTDLRFFQRPFAVPGAACYGPIGGSYHGVDEWVDLASIADVATVLALLLRRWRRHH